MSLKEYLNTYIRYEKSTGILYWKLKPKHTHVKVGDICGYKDKNNNYNVKVLGCLYRRSTLIYFIETGILSSSFLKLNKNNSDDRIENLKCIKQRKISVKNLDKTLYWVWSQMLQRCHNPKNKNHNNYGGRGIFVCKEWQLSYESFLKDMITGYSKGLTIERINNNLGYSKDNCRWATRKEQNDNTRVNMKVEIDGFLLSRSDHCKRVGLPRSTVYSRIRNGYNLEEALKLYKERVGHE